MFEPCAQSLQDQPPIATRTRKHHWNARPRFPPGPPWSSRTRCICISRFVALSVRRLECHLLPSAARYRSHEVFVDIVQRHPQKITTLSCLRISRAANVHPTKLGFKSWVVRESQTAMWYQRVLHSHIRDTAQWLCFTPMSTGPAVSLLCFRIGHHRFSDKHVHQYPQEDHVEVWALADGLPSSQSWYNDASP